MTVLDWIILIIAVPFFGFLTFLAIIDRPSSPLPIDVLSDDHPDYRIVTYEKRLLVNKNGRLAIPLRSDGRWSLAIQEVNNDGSISKKRPYFIGNANPNWKESDFIAVVVVQEAKRGRFNARTTSGLWAGLYERGIAIQQSRSTKVSTP